MRTDTISSLCVSFVTDKRKLHSSRAHTIWKCVLDVLRILWLHIRSLQTWSFGGSRVGIYERLPPLGCGGKQSGKNKHLGRICCFQLRGTIIPSWISWTYVWTHWKWSFYETSIIFWQITLRHNPEIKIFIFLSCKDPLCGITEQWGSNSYSAGVWFETRPGNRPHCLRSFVIFLSLSRKI